MPQRKMQAGHSSLPLRKLESDAEDRRCYGHCRRYYSPLPQRRIESDAEGRCGDGRSRRAILHRHYNYAASIRKFGPEIKNRCTKDSVNLEKPASIPKSGPEIKNRCTLEGLNREFLTSILKSGLEIKNRCMKQHIPRHAFHRAPKHASCLGCFAWGRARAGSTVAAKVGADAPGGGISLRFCRRGCAAPAFKAATLIVPPPRLLQAEPFFFAATNIRIGRGALLRRGLALLRQTKKRMTSADVILFDL